MAKEGQKRTRYSNFAQPRTIALAVMAVGFLVFGLYLAEAGRVVWSDAHNPTATAHIDNRRCWTSEGSDGSENLCDLVVTYKADEKPVTTKMHAVDEGGIVGHEIRVSYSPSEVSDASGPENDSGTALGAWAFAAAVIALSGWLLWSCLTGRLPN